MKPDHDEHASSCSRSILDKLIGAQNSGKAPAGQPTIPDLATEVIALISSSLETNSCRCSARMMMGFKETLWDYCRFSLVQIWAKITRNFHLRSSVCRGVGPHLHMTSVMKKVEHKITLTVIYFASSGLPHERSFTIKCIIEGKHIEVPICNKWFLTKSVDLKPRLVLANLRNLQNVRRQIKWFRHV